MLLTRPPVVTVLWEKSVPGYRRVLGQLEPTEAGGKRGRKIPFFRPKPVSVALWSFDLCRVSNESALMLMKFRHPLFGYGEKVCVVAAFRKIADWHDAAGSQFGKRIMLWQ
jgi:hypothetical protein